VSYAHQIKGKWKEKQALTFKHEIDFDLCARPDVDPEQPSSEAKRNHFASLCEQARAISAVDIWKKKIRTKKWLWKKVFPTNKKTRKYKRQENTKDKKAETKQENTKDKKIQKTRKYKRQENTKDKKAETKQENTKDKKIQKTRKQKQNKIVLYEPR
jgi:hypothetical protein